MLKPVGSDHQITSSSFHSDIHLHSSCPTGGCDTLSSCYEDGCFSYVAYPFRKLWQGVVWLFSKIFCCYSCSKTEEASSPTTDPLTKVKSAEQVKLQKLEEMKTFFNENKEDGGFKAQWKQRFNQLPQDLQDLIIRQGVHVWTGNYDEIRNEDYETNEVIVRPYIINLEITNDGEIDYDPLTETDVIKTLNGAIKQLGGEISVPKAKPSSQVKALQDM